MLYMLIQLLTATIDNIFKVNMALKSEVHITSLLLQIQNAVPMQTWGYKASCMFMTTDSVRHHRMSNVLVGYKRYCFVGLTNLAIPAKIYYDS